MKKKISPRRKVGKPSLNNSKPKTIPYKYNEQALFEEVRRYVDSTYGQHYSLNKFQATEFIIDRGHGVGFLVGNIMKRAQRYGLKDGYNRKDILKIIHEAFMLLYVHDTQTSEIK